MDLKDEDLNMAREINAAKESLGKASFDEFMSQPMTKVLISQIPKGPDDVLETLLQTAHRVGVNTGEKAVADVLMNKLLPLALKAMREKKVTGG